MKVALVHDHLLEFGGAERVLVALKKVSPQADVYVSAYDKKVVDTWIPDFDSWNVYTSWVSHIPFYKKLYSPLRFLAPWIWESFDFTKYDRVISSSGWFMSKGVITKPHTKHISYIHHPPSYLYYYQTAMEWQKYLPIKIYAHFINHFIRMWDFTSSQRPDILVANGVETHNRIQKFYRRDSAIVYPPVHVVKEDPDYSAENKTYYVSLCRLAFKKHVDVLIKAANTHGFPLKVCGTGREDAYLRSLAGPTVEFMGYVDDTQLRKLYAGAKAYLTATEDEEFGIAAVEALGYGVPVIALDSGGLKETVHTGKNGYLFEKLTEASLYDSIKKLEKLSASEYIKMCKAARKEALSYDFEEFKKNMLRLVA